MLISLNSEVTLPEVGSKLWIFSISSPKNWILTALSAYAGKISITSPFTRKFPLVNSLKDLEYRALTKLSVSTKIPEYLNTNKLVIAYGPSDIASIRLIADHGIGLVIHDKKDIRPKIGKILDNLKQITILSEKARNFASTKFDIEKLSSEFKKTIENTIHHSWKLIL